MIYITGWILIAGFHGSPEQLCGVERIRYNRR